MKKPVIVAVLVCAIAAGAFAWKKYSDSAAFFNSLAPHLKNASIRVTNSIQLDTEPSQITFKELFDKLDGDIVEIDKHIIEVQSLTTSDTASVTEPLVSYLKQCQELSRSLAMKYRKQLAYDRARESSSEALQDMRTSNQYSYEFASKQVDRAVDAMKKAATEQSEASKDIVSAANKLKSLRKQASTNFPPDALVSEGKLDIVIKKNTAKEEQKTKS
jgi:hypothetical protein